MFITSKKFLKYIANKKVIAAFDISGSVPSKFRDEFVPTMTELRKNCKIKTKPRMVVFDHTVYEQEYHIWGRVQYDGYGGSDIDKVYRFIGIGEEQPDVLIIFSDGEIPWSKENILPHVQQFIVIFGKVENSNHPDYVEFLEQIKL